MLKNQNAIGVKDLVYPQNRYKRGIIPNMMYVPGKHLLFKMMRACLGCKHESDLWFNRQFGQHDDSGSQSDGVPIDYDNMPEPDKNDSDETPRYREESM